MLRPTPRPGIYEIYWRFAAERQRVFEQRLTGAPGPWTDDPILATYKFCNVFRAADRVSQYYIREVAYGADDSSDDDRLFQTVAFRTFSNTATWDGLLQRLGRSPRIEDLESDAFENALGDIRGENGRLYTGAFILCATDAYGRGLKHLNHVELFRDMFLGGDLPAAIERAQGMSDAFDALHRFPLIGDFMAYQIATDINYSELTDFDENEFTRPGPGAVRGLKKVFLDLGGLTPEQAILWMVEQQESEFERLELEFGGLFGRPIHAIDAQNLFCEVDKYCREAAPQLASSRSRIKAKFTPGPAAAPLFFPPKWGLNDKLPSCGLASVA